MTYFDQQVDMLEAELQAGLISLEEFQEELDAMKAEQSAPWRWFN